jgi:phenylacetate-CoA ligase
VAQLRRFALARSPFYREFHRGLEQRPLQDLPILTKAMMMERFDELVTDRAVRLTDAEAYLRDHDGAQLFRRRYVVMSTSGSTGRRGVFLFDSSEWIRALASITRPISWIRPVRTRKGVPRSALIAASAPWHFSARVGRALATTIVPTLRIDAATPIDEMVARLNEWQPASLATYPSVLRELAAAQNAGKLHIELQAIASSAEVLTAELRAAVKRAWGDAILQDTYGATEYAPIATECSHGRKHLFEDGAVIEVADDAGRVLGPGEQGTRLLLTIFKRCTQPLIRYEISDLVRLTGEPCPCGRPYRTIDSIEGRQEDVLYFEAAAGNAPIAIHPNRVHDALERFPVTAWQVVQEDTAITIRLIGSNGPDECAAVERAMREMLQATGVHAPHVIVTRVKQLERGPTGKAPLILANKRRISAALREEGPGGT